MHKIDAEIIMEGMGMCKTLAETTAEIGAGEILIEVIEVMSRSRERCPTPRRYSNRQFGNSRLESRSRSRFNPRITNRDRIRCYKCREYDHFTNECHKHWH